jgi:hypothetical protein
MSDRRNRVLSGFRAAARTFSTDCETFEEVVGRVADEHEAEPWEEIVMTVLSQNAADENRAEPTTRSLRSTRLTSPSSNTTARRVVRGRQTVGSVSWRMSVRSTVSEIKTENLCQGGPELLCYRFNSANI